MKRNQTFLFLLFLFAGTHFNALNAQVKKNVVPFIGAQVFIEPGQTTEDIDNWFRHVERK